MEDQENIIEKLRNQIDRDEEDLIKFKSWLKERFLPVIGILGLNGIFLSAEFENGGIILFISVISILIVFFQSKNYKYNEGWLNILEIYYNLNTYEYKVFIDTDNKLCEIILTYDEKIPIEIVKDELERQFSIKIKRYYVKQNAELSKLSYFFELE